MPPPPIFFSSGFVLLQLEAETIISNFALFISEDNDHDDDDVECNGDDNRKKHHVIKYHREHAFNSVMSNNLRDDSPFDDKQFEQHF